VARLGPATTTNVHGGGLLHTCAKTIECDTSCPHWIYTFDGDSNDGEETLYSQQKRNRRNRGLSVPRARIPGWTLVPICGQFIPKPCVSIGNAQSAIQKGLGQGWLDHVASATPSVSGMISLALEGDGDRPTSFSGSTFRRCARCGSHQPPRGNDNAIRVPIATIVQCRVDARTLGKCSGRRRYRYPCLPAQTHSR
jgi:hypothetical protein